MRWLLFLLCFPAFAAPPPVVPGVVGEVSMQFPPRVVRGDAGWHIWWFYRSSDMTLYSNGFSCPHGVCDRSLLASVYQDIMTAPDRIAALNTAWATYITYECKDVLGEQTPRGAACRERGVTFEANKSVWLAGYVAPVVEVWKVAYNSACSDANKLAGTCTRPVSVYNPLTKTRSVAKGETVAVGAPCYPAVITHKDSPTSSITYMAINPDRTDRVAVCTKG